MKADIKADLTAVGAIYILIVLLSTYIFIHIENTKQFQILQNQLITIQQELVKTQEDLSMMEENTKSLNEYADTLEYQLKDLHKLETIRRELRNYTTEEKSVGLALYWTEGNWERYPDHKDNGYTQGGCGVTPFWNTFLAEKGISKYSIEACIEIYKYYKEKTKSQYDAIKEYKGAERNTKIVDHTIKLKNKIKSMLKSN